MSLLQVISDAWAWRGLSAVELIGQNQFGNVIVRNEAGEYWRIVPEFPDIELLASSADEFSKVIADPDFDIDWEMEALVQRARMHLGPLEAGRCYCLKLPAFLGGSFEQDDNLGSISMEELMSFAGDLARQIDCLPDGAQVEIKIVD